MATASLGGFTISGGPLADAIAKQSGYTTQDQQNAFGAWTPDKWGGNLSPELLNGVTKQGWTVDPSANISGSAPSQFVYDPTTGGVQYHPAGQGAGENYYTYDNTGKFTGTQKGSGIMSYLQGILAVAGAGAGMAALGGAAGAGAAAGDAGGFVGEGATSGVPAWDSALAGSTAGAPAAASTGGLASSFLKNLATKAPGLLAGGGGSSGGGNMDLGSLVSGLGPLLGGVSSAVNQGNASGKMIDWLNQQQGRIDNTFAPGSPEATNLWDQMSRMDAAAGRNSQYGPRTVDLATKLAQMKMDASTRLAMGFAKPYQDALNQNAGRFAGLTSALGNGSQNGSLAQLINMLTGGGGGSNLFSDVPFNYGDTGNLASGNFTDSLGSTNYFDPTGMSGTGGASYGIDVSNWF